jgi:tricorn protease
VPEDPTALAQGKDPQLDRAIQEVLKKVQQMPAAVPPRPKAEKRN